MSAMLPTTTQERTFIWARFVPITSLRAAAAQRQNVRGVLSECRGHPVDVASELIVADKRRSKRTAESEAFVEDFGNQAFVGAIPHIFVEPSHGFLLP